MKTLWNSFVVAFSMYSKIPMPRADWSEENMKYSMCFFPLVGLVIGALEWGWLVLSLGTGLGPGLRAAVFLLIPILISGGIHLDGFLDTADAMSSWRDREKRLEILKDSHAGAFAIIMGASYFILYFGAALEVDLTCFPALLGLWAASRCFSAFSVVTFPKANPGGTVALFDRNAVRVRVRVAVSICLLVLVAAGLMVCPADTLILLAVLLTAFAYYYYMSMKYFGGITGDLAGFFVSLAELAGLVLLTAVHTIGA